MGAPCCVHLVDRLDYIHDHTCNKHRLVQFQTLSGTLTFALLYASGQYTVMWDARKVSAHINTVLR